MARRRIQVTLHQRCAQSACSLFLYEAWYSAGIRCLRSQRLRVDVHIEARLELVPAVVAPWVRASRDVTDAVVHTVSFWIRSTRPTDTGSHRVGQDGACPGEVGCEQTYNKWVSLPWFDFAEHGLPAAGSELATY